MTVRCDCRLARPQQGGPVYAGTPRTSAGSDPYADNRPRDLGEYESLVRLTWEASGLAGAELLMLHGLLTRAVCGLTAKGSRVPSATASSRCQHPPTTKRNGPRLIQSGSVVRLMVAGTGFEPATFGL